LGGVAVEDESRFDAEKEALKELEAVEADKLDPRLLTAAAIVTAPFEKEV
jgi:hypothetical protein